MEREEYQFEMLKLEYERLREDRKQLDNNKFKLFIIFATVSFTGIFALVKGFNLVSTKESIEINNYIWGIILLSFPFLTYLFISVFLILAGTAIQNSANLIVVEKELNKLAEHNLYVWENILIKKSFISNSITNAVGSLFLLTFIFALDISCVVLSKNFLTCYNWPFYLAINCIILTLFICVLFYNSIYERSKIEGQLEKSFGKNLNESQT